MSDNSAITGFAGPADALAWLVAMGADEIILEKPVDRFAEMVAPTPPNPVSPSKPITRTAPVADATGLNSIAEIAQALNFLESHPLRKNASKLSFFEGRERAEILVVSDRPRTEEDKSGLVFAAKARLLLENMLAAINVKLEDVALMNLVPWRPAGNAAPKESDILSVLPFARRAIELTRPKLILAFTSLPGQHLAGGDPSILRQRGKWLDAGGIPLLSTLHPDELLKHPLQKKLAWRDLQIFRERLK